MSSLSRANEHKSKASAYLNAGHRNLAMEEFKSALALEMSILGAKDIVVARTTLSVSGILQANGEYEEALTLLYRVIEVLKEHGDSHALVLLGAAYINAGSCELSLGKYAESFASYKEALSCKQRTFGENSIEV